jgi:hypothetical protein
VTGQDDSGAVPRGTSHPGERNAGTPVLRTSHPTATKRRVRAGGAARHEHLVLAGHHVEVTEDDIGVTELHLE